MGFLTVASVSSTSNGPGLDASFDLSLLRYMGLTSGLSIACIISLNLQSNCEITTHVTFLNFKKGFLAQKLANFLDLKNQYLNPFNNLYFVFQNNQIFQNNNRNNVVNNKAIFFNRVIIV